MNNHGTEVAELFAAKALEKFFEMGVTPFITNDEYEGEIRDKASKLVVMTFGEDQGLQTYSGANLTLGNVQESPSILNTDQAKAYYFGVKSINVFKSAVKDPESTLMIEKAGQLQEAVDSYIMGFYTDVASGNRVGTDYTTGTVTVDVTTGAVTGSGTTFVTGMVGKGFKAAGHTVWYRIKTFTSTTAIVIEDDYDDVTSAYTGGAIGAGATYTIEANTSVTLTAANIYGYMLKLKQRLDEDKTPRAGRWLVVNSRVMEILSQADVVVRDVESDDMNIENGFEGRIAGFMVYQNEQVRGDNTTGYWVLAGHKVAITFAMGFVETGIEDLQGNFGKAYKGLNVYGAKVPDVRRKNLAALFCKV